MYMFGGRDKDYKAVDHVQVYDTAIGQVSLSPNPMPAAQRLMRAALWESKALLIGQWTCYIYDFESDTWQERKSYLTGLIHFGLTLDVNTLYISGGGTVIKDENNKEIWTCVDDVKSLCVDDFISGRAGAEWRHHAKLPQPTFISSFSPIPLFIDKAYEG